MTANKPTFWFYDNLLSLDNISKIIVTETENALWLYIYWRRSHGQLTRGCPLCIKRRDADLPKYFLARTIQLQEAWHKHLLQKQVEPVVEQPVTDMPTQVFDISNDLEQLESDVKSANKRLDALEDKSGALSMQVFSIINAVKNTATAGEKMAQGAKYLATSVAELEAKVASIDNALERDLKECTAKIETALKQVGNVDKEGLDALLIKLDGEFRRHVFEREVAINTRMRDDLAKIKYVFACGMTAALVSIGASIVYLLLV